MAEVRANSFLAMAHIMELNEFKRKLLRDKAPVTAETFRNGLKECGIPSNILFWTEFKKSGIITEVEGNMYVWKTRFPIHHLTLQAIYKRYQSKVNAYNKVRVEKEKDKKKEVRKQLREAIDLLKSHGFEIFAPNKDLYKKL